MVLAAVRRLARRPRRATSHPRAPTGWPSSTPRGRRPSSIDPGGQAAGPRTPGSRPRSLRVDGQRFRKPRTGADPDYIPPRAVRRHASRPCSRVRQGDTWPARPRTPATGVTGPPPRCGLRMVLAVAHSSVYKHTFSDSLGGEFTWGRRATSRPTSCWRPGTGPSWPEPGRRSRRSSRRPPDTIKDKVLDKGADAGIAARHRKVEAAHGGGSADPAGPSSLGLTRHGLGGDARVRPRGGRGCAARRARRRREVTRRRGHPAADPVAAPTVLTAVGAGVAVLGLVAYLALPRRRRAEADRTRARRHEAVLGGRAESSRVSRRRPRCSPSRSPVASWKVRHVRAHHHHARRQPRATSRTWATRSCGPSPTVRARRGLLRHDLELERQDVRLQLERPSSSSTRENTTRRDPKQACIDIETGEVQPIESSAARATYRYRLEAFTGTPARLASTEPVSCQLRVLRRLLTRADGRRRSDVRVGHDARAE